MCGKQWEGRHAATNLVMHLKMFHEKSLKCPHCDYLCGYEKTLKRHMLKHLGCNSIDILRNIPKPVPNHAWSYETCLNFKLPSTEVVSKFLRKS